MTMTVEAHISIRTPCGRYQPAAGCPSPPPGQSIDYDINSPIGTHSRQDQPLCKHTVPFTKRQVYKAGETINTAYSVGASHGGGHCQYALSYDDGKTWVVIKTVIRDCFKDVTSSSGYTVPVQIPAGAPSGKATFMWLWNNAIGNRELYSNCADIEIQGTEGGKIEGVEPLIANYGPSSFLFPEFPHTNDDDGHAEFENRKAITITANGSGGGNGGSGQPVPPTKPTTTPTMPSKVPVPPKPTQPANPANPVKTVYKYVTVTKTVHAAPTGCRP
ncbi:hypothetical protein EDD11_005622 [Mortierella claussenii]|nr:hypothetical protein EDD11_005622 [Mortierella claussenii]